MNWERQILVAETDSKSSEKNSIGNRKLNRGNMNNLQPYPDKTTRIEMDSTNMIDSIL